MIFALMMSLTFCRAQTSSAQHPGQRPAGASYTSEDALVERIFPLFEAIDNDAGTRKILATDPELREITQERWSSIASAAGHCDGDRNCVCETLVWDGKQIAKSSEALRRLYETSPQLQLFVKTELQPSQAFAYEENATPEDLLLSGWQHAAQSMNSVISTYCKGKNPRYPKIDSMTFEAGSETYSRLIQTMLGGLTIRESTAASLSEESLFFVPTLRFAIRLLQANGRDEAARFHPLDLGENAAALKHAKEVVWSLYPYTAVVLLGEGPEDPNVDLSPWGKERIRLGVAAYRTGKAPFILVSGGFVHPSRTLYCEALEMKRYLLQVYGLPEAAVLIDPYARHTTTNLRNASREVLTYAFPTDRPLLIVSDPIQIRYVESEIFAQRNLAELGYQPVRLGKHISATAVEAMPLKHSLLQDAADPLDP
jgi:hypothetical protein